MQSRFFTLGVKDFELTLFIAHVKAGVGGVDVLKVAASLCDAATASWRWGCRGSDGGPKAISAPFEIACVLHKS